MNLRDKYLSTYESIRGKGSSHKKFITNLIPEHKAALLEVPTK